MSKSADIHSHKPSKNLTDTVPVSAGRVWFPHHLNLAHKKVHGKCRSSGKTTNPAKHGVKLGLASKMKMHFLCQHLQSCRSMKFKFGLHDDEI